MKKLNGILRVLFWGVQLGDFFYRPREGDSKMPKLEEIAVFWTCLRLFVICLFTGVGALIYFMLLGASSPPYWLLIIYKTVLILGVLTGALMEFVYRPHLDSNRTVGYVTVGSYKKIWRISVSMSFVWTLVFFMILIGLVH